MSRLLQNLTGRIGVRLIATVGAILLASVLTWAFSDISYQQRESMMNITSGADRLLTTVKLGTHYAMMHNARGEIREIIKNVSNQPDILAIRIYNKSGQIRFSNVMAEVDRTTNIKDEACHVCHHRSPPLIHVPLEGRTRFITAADNTRQLGILSAIFSEPGCASSECHFHPKDKQVLGALDMVISLSAADKKLAAYTRRIFSRAAVIFFATTIAIAFFIQRYVNRPVTRMMDMTRRIAEGEYTVPVPEGSKDEMGQLAGAIGHMGREIGLQQKALKKQRREYQNLFEAVPCLITVQDRDLRLINYNREFSDSFDPTPGDFCFHAYKGRQEKCDPCPVEKTFMDGLSHRSEESTYTRSRKMRHWIVITNPVVDEAGNVTAAMEISLDITDRKLLEMELRRSEQKYHSIFNNMPHPTFVLDSDTMAVLDCNDNVFSVYGYNRREIIGRPFGDLYQDSDDRRRYAERLGASTLLDTVMHRKKDGGRLYVNIRVSPSQFNGQKVLLVTTSDVTKRLETEQQLHQASKMATLGEMATGVAHELNQPLSVIKTVSSFFIKKIGRAEPIDTETLNTMLVKVDENVDRAEKIITHMRLFARKDDMKCRSVVINDVIERAMEMFVQQLRARGIDIRWELDRGVPPVRIDPDRIEQVFINLILNARDAIEQRWEGQECGEDDRRITIRTRRRDAFVVVEIEDTGIGIEDTDREKIFDPFFTTKPVGKGTGLGLSISYGIVRDCGGSIHVDPKPPPGARFSIRFPIKENENGRNHPPGG